MTEPSKITQTIIDLVLQRDAAGRAKYGTTLDRTDLSQAEWLQHLAEELLDAAGYALAAKRRISDPWFPVNPWPSEEVDTSTGDDQRFARENMPPPNPVSLPEGCRVMWATGSLLRDGDRWEVYGPQGGGVVSEWHVECPTVRSLLDALAAASGSKK